MSRETDSSSSGPQGRGGAAYPSGTPPYGSRQYPSLHPSQGGSDENPESVDPPRPEEPKTETTLTTRIRINIPGSRPIPPVVMRTPMAASDISGDGGSDTERTGATPRPGTPPAAPGPGASAGAGSPDRSGGPSSGSNGGAPADRSRDGGPAADPTPGEKPAREKSGSDWFAPRKAPTAGPAAAGQGTGGPGGAGNQGGPGGPGAGGPGGPGGPSAGGPGGPASGGPGGPGGPGSGDLGGPGGAPDGGAGRSRPDLPYFSDAPQSGGGPGAPGSGPARSALDSYGTEPPGGGPRATPGPGVRTPGPSGPTTGPVTGTSSLTPNLDGVPGLGGPGPMVPGTPGGVPPRMSDDTAILTPQAPAPEPGPGGHVSGDTLTSGIPVVPSEPRATFPGRPGTPGAPVTGQGGPGGPGGPGVPAPGPAAPRPAPKAAAAPASAPAKKGRSKLVLLGVAAVVLLGIAYGAGLLLNHAEVPKGTTVLGVDIGGGTKEEAVTKLEAALGERAKAPMTLSVDGKEEKLDPEKAGLTLDSQETVRGAAGSDYNPVSVIGSLFGGERPADPVIPVDEEKLGVALTDLAGASGSANDGTIRFEPNKAVAVPGKPGKTLDAGQSLISVRDAYRAQVQTGKANVVELPVTTSEPTITQAELNRAMKEFAEPAMSGLITIKAGPKQIQFGPARSLPQILSMKPVDGRLVDVYDKKAIDTLLDGVFDGIMAVKADGKKHQVGPDDVAQAMKTALAGKTPAERTVTISLTGEG
ncbi:hypothetical protein [Streptomyces sp. MCL20-2]|uniref:hypothetical protein n=1 Tax=Streptomyces sp. MCL20-2 TaxID=2967219 RepID=UPI0029671959|nr:hypothetical protein [Streptomyces sp. MCL20-2]